MSVESHGRGPALPGDDGLGSKQSDADERGPDLSIIVPCFNEARLISPFFERTSAVLDGLDLTWEILLIDDGSRDETTSEAKRWARADARIRVFSFARNFGKEAALTAGLDYSRGQAVIPIDVDLQDPPEVIPELIKWWQCGHEIVLARRVDRRSDPWLKRMTAAAFYRVMNRFGSLQIAENVGDFRLLDRKVVNVVRRLRERNRFMKGLLAWPGFSSTIIEYTRAPRSAGQSRWNYWRLWNFALDGLTSFSTAPLRIWTYIGAGIAFAAFLYATFLVIRTLVFGVDVAGYASLMVTILFLGGVQLLTLGVIGEYLGRLYIEVKGRPIYVLRDAPRDDPHND